MGKAAILVGPVVVIVLAMIVWGIIRMIVKSSQEPKNIRQNALLSEEAFELFRDILVPKSLDGDVSYLSNDHTAKVKAWAEKYRKVNS